MVDRIKTKVVAVLIVMFLCLGTSFADTQEITLTDGWNAVFINVQPEVNDCNSLFGSIEEIEMVYSYENDFSSLQFMGDENNLVSNDPKWLTWQRGNVDLGLGNQLSHIVGGSAYIFRVNLDGGETTKKVTLEGTTVLRNIQWRANQFNLVGFQFGANPPTYESFFSDSSAHEGQAIYRMNPSSGAWERLWVWEGPNQNPQHKEEAMKSGEAFWIHTEGFSEFQGPIRINVDQLGGLDFGKDIDTQVVKIYNESKEEGSNETKTITIQLIGDEVPLSYKNVEIDDDGNIKQITWEDLLDEPEIQVTVSPGASFQLDLAIRRKKMLETVLPEERDFYEGQLKITDGPFEKFIPIRADKVKALDNPYAGLWVGTATINGVSSIEKTTATISEDDIKEVSSPFQFRLIFHVNETVGVDGKVMLLNEVTQVIHKDTKELELVGGGNTDWSNYIGASLRDGVPVGRRISSAAFSSSATVDSLGFGTGVVKFEKVSCLSDDPLNPFYHQFHPDHDNLDERFEEKVTEAFNINRSIQLNFGEPGDFTPGLGDSVLTGKYSEDIELFLKEGTTTPLKVKVGGAFTLSRISSIDSIK